jgi:Protein of unknown function (DUF4058)
LATKSPFPGLDPYLEMHWGDAHQRLIMYAADALQSGLPESLLARVGERVYVEREEYRLRSIDPDAHHVVEVHPTGSGGGTAVVIETEVVETRTFVVEPIEVTEGFIEIVEASGGKVVTVVEVLSPANKVPGPGRDLYEKKQIEILQSSTNLVEIDLERAGRRVLALPVYFIPKEWRGDALACVRRHWRPNQSELHRLPLRRKLPSIPIPLRESDPPALLDLQAIHDQCYRNGRYDRTDYSAPPEPPLAVEDAAWTEELLVSAGKRGDC